MWRVQYCSETGSTNDDLKIIARLGEREGYVLCAERQTAGRGRQGRVWQSEVGNLYCSLLLRPTTLEKDLPQYSFMSALAIYDTVLANLNNITINLKWPNDVLVNRKKISGVLLESESGWLVIGIGLNVNSHPHDTFYPSTSLLENGAQEKDLKIILGQLLHSLQKWYMVVQKEGFAPIRHAWTERALRGRVSVREGQNFLEGEFKDLNNEGHLRLKLADGSERAIATGDVFPL